MGHMLKSEHMRRLTLSTFLCVAAAGFGSACVSDVRVVEKIVEVPVEEVRVVKVEVEKVHTVETEKIVEVEVERVTDVFTTNGCGGTNSCPVTPTPTPSDGPHFGGTLRVVSQSGVDSLDPVFTEAYTTVAVSSHIFETPLGWNSRMEVGPRMAASWELSPDGLTYTFHLRGRTQVPQRRRCRERGYGGITRALAGQ